MPIRQYLGGSPPFDPDDLAIMGRALTAAVAKLGQPDSKDPMVEEAARRIVRAALAGERNVSKLIEIATAGQDHSSKSSHG